MSATQMAYLSDLPHDVLVVIAKQLKKLEDFVSFRCVSKSLHAAVKDEYFEGLRLRQRTPYLLLPVRDDGNDDVRDDVNDDVRELYSLVEGESMVASVKAPKLKTKKCFESLGWLLAIGEDGNMSLLDPLSSAIEILLPHQNTFPRYDEDQMDAHFCIRKMVLSSRPNEASDFVLVVIFGGEKQLAFWRLGDKAWNSTNECDDQFTDVVYCGNGQFYAIGGAGMVWIFNLDGNDSNPKGRMIINCRPVVPDLKSLNPTPFEHPMRYYVYGSLNIYILKTIDDALLIVTRISPNLCEDGSSYITTKFHVYEVDIAMTSWKEIYSLGRMAIFLGHNSTIVVDASRFSGGVIKPNHIYFTEDELEYYYYESPKGGGTDMGVYNLETGTVELIYPGEPLLSRVSTSIWINPCI